MARPVVIVEGPPLRPDSLGALGFSFKKAFKKIGKTIKERPGAILKTVKDPSRLVYDAKKAPGRIVRQAMLPTRLLTAGGGAIGIKPLAKVDAKLNQATRWSESHPLETVGIAAAAVGAAFAAPAILSAAGAVASAAGGAAGTLVTSSALPTALSVGGKLLGSHGAGETPATEVGTNPEQDRMATGGQPVAEKKRFPPGAAITELVTSPMGLGIIGLVVLGGAVLYLTRTPPIAAPIAYFEPPRRRRRRRRR